MHNRFLEWGFVVVACMCPVFKRDRFAVKTRQRRRHIAGRMINLAETLRILLFICACSFCQSMYVCDIKHPSSSLSPHPSSVAFAVAIYVSAVVDGGVG